MSTTYYKLKSPFTDLYVYTHSHDEMRVGIGVRGHYAGELSVKPKDITDVVLAFADTHNPVMHVFAGVNGAQLEELQPNLPGITIVISEYGKVYSVAELRVKYAHSALQSPLFPT